MYFFVPILFVYPINAMESNRVTNNEIRLTKRLVKFFIFHITYFIYFGHDVADLSIAACLVNFLLELDAPKPDSRNLKWPNSFSSFGE